MKLRLRERLERARAGAARRRSERARAAARARGAGARAGLDHPRASARRILQERPLECGVRARLPRDRRGAGGGALRARRGTSGWPSGWTRAIPCWPRPCARSIPLTGGPRHGRGHVAARPGPHAALAARPARRWCPTSRPDPGAWRGELLEQAARARRELRASAIAGRPAGGRARRAGGVRGVLPVAARRRAARPPAARCPRLKPRPSAGAATGAPPRRSPRGARPGALDVDAADALAAGARLAACTRTWWAPAGRAAPLRGEEAPRRACSTSWTCW